MVFYELAFIYKLKESVNIETGNKEEAADVIPLLRQTRKDRFEWVTLVSDINHQLSIENRLNGNISVLIIGGKPGKIRVLAACKLENVTLKECKAYIKKAIRKADDRIEQLNFELKREIGVNHTEELVHQAKNNGLVKENDFFIKALDQNHFNSPYYFVEEMCVEGKLTHKQAIKRANELMADDTLLEEIDRIYSKDNVKKYYGNPVHYKITVGSPDVARDIYELLALALKSNKRLLGSRVEVLSDIGEYCYDEDDVYNIFSFSQGNCVVVDMSGDYLNCASSYDRVVDYLNSLITKFGIYTLCFFVEYTNAPGFSHNMISKVSESIDIVEIKEGVGDYAKSLALFKSLAKDDAFDATEDDFKKQLPEKRRYTATEIYSAHMKWRGNVLNMRAYKAYRTCNLVRNKDNSSDPYQELQNMIGLAEIKSVVDQIIAFGKARQLRSERGMDIYKPSMHMLFTGNPGSAKTCVARLLSKILKKEGIIESGKIIEVGRAQLVDKYVGWTAKNVCEKFDAAQGGILFIDEAYSLVEDRNSFGDEAINTIVQEMENRRDNVIVIFAGYPEKMKEFLDKNEGLRSRITFHLNFPDYTVEELWQILKLMSEKHGFTLADGVESKCKEVFENACTHEQYGNGRFVRNLLAQAIMCQSRRVFEEARCEKISRDRLAELQARDFSTAVGQQFKEKTHPMGFGI